MKIRIALICVLTFALARSAEAVFPAKLPLPKMYETSASVLVARVSKLTELNRVVDVEVTDAIKGDKTDKLRIQVVKPEGIFKQLREGDPIVICTSRGRGAGDATIHLADTFLLGRLKPQTSPPVWQIIDEQSNDFKKTFPGTTPLLIEALRELKNQKPTFLNSADDRMFSEGAVDVAQLKITPTALFAADFNGDKLSELLVATAHGPRIFTKNGESYEDITVKFSLPESGQLLAVGDLNGDSKLDLLIDKTPYLRQEMGFKSAAPLDVPARNDLLAISIANGRVFALTKGGRFSNGIESKQLWNAPAAPAGAQSQQSAIIGAFDTGDEVSAIVVDESSLIRYSLDGRASDFTRLTGEPLSSYLKSSGGKFKNPKLVSLDANGDGRRDLLVLSEGANFLLINRGFGAYFISPGAGSLALGSAPDKQFPFAAYATLSHWAAIETRPDHREDLLILTPDATLYRLGNPPPK